MEAVITLLNNDDNPPPWVRAALLQSTPCLHPLWRLRWPRSTPGWAGPGAFRLRRGD